MTVRHITEHHERVANIVFCSRSNVQFSKYNVDHDRFIKLEDISNYISCTGNKDNFHQGMDSYGF